MPCLPYIDQSTYLKVLECKLEAASEVNARLRKNSNNYEALQNNYLHLKKEIGAAQKLKDRVSELEAEVNKIQSCYDMETLIMSLYSPEDNRSAISISHVVDLLEKERTEHMCLLHEKGALGAKVKVKELEVEYVRSEVCVFLRLVCINHIC